MANQNMKNSKSNKVINHHPTSSEILGIKSPRMIATGNSSNELISSDDSIIDPKPRNT
jgi:hypothetical protein